MQGGESEPVRVLHTGEYLHRREELLAQESVTVLVSGQSAAEVYRDLACVQIAGLVARRIVCTAHEGDRLMAGERFGIIRFGSRTDVYLPIGVKPLVLVGQTMIGGESILAELA